MSPVSRGIVQRMSDVALEMWREVAASYVTHTAAGSVRAVGSTLLRATPQPYFGDEVLPLGDLVQAVTAAGWRVIHLSTADQREWDDFEGDLASRAAGVAVIQPKTIADPIRYVTKSTASSASTWIAIEASSALSISFSPSNRSPA